MADFRIRIVVDPAAAVRNIARVKNGLKGLEDQAGKVGNLFRAAMAIQAAERAISVVANLAGAYTTMENKVRSVTKSASDFKNVMTQIPEVAKRSRASLEAIATGFQSFSSATETMGLNSNTVLRMTETLQKTLLLSGATQAEAASTMTQYGQALRKGYLNGDEFRSIMENNVVVQKLLARELGVTTDKLKGLSTEGKITRDIMVNALVNGAGEIDAAFANSMPTLQDRVTQFKNEMILMVGQFAKTIDLSTLVGKFFDYLAEKIKNTVEKVQWLVGNLKDLSDWANKATGGTAGTIAGVGLDMVTGIGVPGSKYSPLGLMGRGLGSGAGMAANALGYGNEGADEDWARVELPPWMEDPSAIVRATSAMIGMAVSIERVNEGMAATRQVVAGKELANFAGIVKDVALAALDPSKGKDEAYAATGGNLAVAQVLDALYGDEKKPQKGPKDTLPEELDRLLGSLNPVVAASMDLDKAESVLAQGRRRGLITLAQYNSALEAYLKLHQDALDPVGALGRETKREIDMLELRAQFTTSEAYDREVAYREKVLELTTAGVDISSKAAAQELAYFQRLLGVLDAVTDAKEAANDQEKSRTDLFAKYGGQTGEERFYQERAFLLDSKKIAQERGSALDELEADRGLKKLYADAAAGEYEKGSSGRNAYLRDLRNLELELKRTNTTGEDAARILRAFNAEYDKLGQEAREEDLKNGRAFLESVAAAAEKKKGGLEKGFDAIYQDLNDMSGFTANLIVQNFNRMEDALVSFFTTGEFGMEKMVDAMIADLTRLAVRYALLKLFGLMTGGGGGVIGDALMTPKGFATGGTAKVGGHGGTDSTFVPLMMTPGENLTVTRRGDPPEAGRDRSPTRVVVTTRVVSNTRGAMLAAMKSPAAARTQIAHLQENEAALRGLLGPRR